MPLTKITKDMDIIVKLDAEPNDVGGLTDTELQAKFDEGGKAIKDYINNTLTAEIETQFATKAENALKANADAVYTKSETDAAFPSNADVLRKDNATAFAPSAQYHPSTKKYVDDTVAGVVLGQIPDNSLTATKMANEMKKNIAGGVAAYDTVTAHLADNAAHNLSSKLDKNGGTIQNYSETLTANPAATGAVTLDITNGNVFVETLTGATTFTFSNPAASGKACSFTLILNQGATPYAVTWPASVKWPGDNIPDVSASSKTSVLVFITTNGGARWYGFLSGAGLVT